jgi:hypothetical protein
VPGRNYKAGETPLLYLNRATLPKLIRLGAHLGGDVVAMGAVDSNLGVELKL